MFFLSLDRFWLVHSPSLPARLSRLLLLSWLYAVCSQMSIPLPFNFVPLSLQPLPLLLAAHWFGATAVQAYVLYLLQGIAGLPFFSKGGSGLVHLCGPTGGYLWGFLLAMCLLVLDKHWANTRTRLALLLVACGGLYFGCGLAQLAFFVPSSRLLAAGLLPFLPGDLAKLMVCWSFMCNKKIRVTQYE